MNNVSPHAFDRALRARFAEGREADELFGIVVEAMPDAVLLADEQGRILLANASCEKLFGYTREELLGHSVEMLVPQRSRGGHPARRADYARHAESRPMGHGRDLFALRKDGTEVPVEIGLNPIRTPDGLLVLSVIVDITERKSAEREMERLASFPAKNPNPIVEFDPEFQRIVYVNAASKCLFPTLERDGAAHPLLAGMSEIARQLRDDETMVVRREASVGSDAFVAQTIVRDPERGTLRIYSTDITERKHVEQDIRALNADLERRVQERTAELQSLFESLPGLYLVLAPDFRIVAASDAYLAATMTTREAIVGRGLFEIFPDNPSDQEATGEANLRASFENVLKHAAPHTMAIQKYDIRRPDGVWEERYWSPINSPIFGADRQVKYIVHRVEDVTGFMRQKHEATSDQREMRLRMEQMEAEIFQSSRRVQEINHQLEAANKELEAFSYSVSHDLRAPLRAVDGYSQAVLEDYSALLPEQGRHYLQTIRESAQRMGALIDDLLSLSRLSRQPVKAEPVDMKRLVESVLEDMEKQREGREVEICVRELPTVSGDPALLRQVWVNLLSNALKYTRGRTPATIDVDAERREGETVFLVRDNGTGFDMRYAGKLFGVFQRLHRMEDYEGTGVGLAIVQRIVHRHGGRVWADAAVDRGATFYFTLGGTS